MPFWRRYVRPEDFVWLLLFSALAVFSPERDTVDLVLLVALGVVQVLDSRIGPIASILLKFALCSALLGYSGGITSSFYPILLLPVISAATALGLRGMVLSTLTACAIFLSFLAFIDWKTEYIDSDGRSEIVLRVLLLPVVGFFTYQLAEANRAEVRRRQKAVEQLEEANQSLREANDQVRRSERLAALGQLTAGLAHELRNPLGTMKTSAELLGRQVGRENEIAREMSGFISAEVDRANLLITRFLDFARPQHLRVEPGSVTELLDSVIARLGREMPETAARVSVYKNYSPDVPSVPFDAQLLERALLNLVSNAAQASPEGGTVTVKTRMVETGGGPRVEIAIIDCGSGIEAKNLENIFNPFFTTKSNGVGLGLSVVSKVIDEHGGQINVESAPGEGSVFRVYLPVGQ